MYYYLRKEKRKPNNKKKRGERRERGCDIFITMMYILVATFCCIVTVLIAVPFISPKPSYAKNTGDIFEWERSAATTTQPSSIDQYIFKDTEMEKEYIVIIYHGISSYDMEIIERKGGVK